MCKTAKVHYKPIVWLSDIFNRYMYFDFSYINAILILAMLNVIFIMNLFAQNFRQFKTGFYIMVSLDYRWKFTPPFFKQIHEKKQRLNVLHDLHTLGCACQTRTWQLSERLFLLLLHSFIHLLTQFLKRVAE